MIQTITSKYYPLVATMDHCGLNDEEKDYFIEAMVNGEAAYGTNVASLVTGQYICETVLNYMEEEESTPILDKMQRFLLDADDKDILFDLEG